MNIPFDTSCPIQKRWRLLLDDEDAAVLSEVSLRPMQSGRDGCERSAQRTATADQVPAGHRTQESRAESERIRCRKSVFAGTFSVQPFPAASGPPTAQQVKR